MTWPLSSPSRTSTDPRRIRAEGDGGWCLPAFGGGEARNRRRSPPRTHCLERPCPCGGSSRRSTEGGEDARPQRVARSRPPCQQQVLRRRLPGDRVRVRSPRSGAGPRRRRWRWIGPCGGRRYEGVAFSSGFPSGRGSPPSRLRVPSETAGTPPGGLSFGAPPRMGRRFHPPCRSTFRRIVPPGLEQALCAWALIGQGLVLPGHDVSLTLAPPPFRSRYTFLATMPDFPPIPPPVPQLEIRKGKRSAATAPATADFLKRLGGGPGWGRTPTSTRHHHVPAEGPGEGHLQIGGSGKDAWIRTPFPPG